MKKETTDLILDTLIVICHLYWIIINTEVALRCFDKNPIGSIIIVMVAVFCIKNTSKKSLQNIVNAIKEKRKQSEA